MAFSWVGKTVDAIWRRGGGEEGFQKCWTPAVPEGQSGCGGKGSRGWRGRAAAAGTSPRNFRRERRWVWSPQRKVPMEATQGQAQHGALSRQPGVSCLVTEQSHIPAGKHTFFLLPNCGLGYPLPGGHPHSDWSCFQTAAPLAPNTAVGRGSSLRSRALAGLARGPPFSSATGAQPPDLSSPAGGMLGFHEVALITDVRARHAEGLPAQVLGGVWGSPGSGAQRREAAVRPARGARRPP